MPAGERGLITYNREMGGLPVLTCVYGFCWKGTLILSETDLSTVTPHAAFPKLVSHGPLFCRVLTGWSGKEIPWSSKFEKHWVTHHPARGLREGSTPGLSKATVVAVLWATWDPGMAMGWREARAWLWVL